MSFADRLNALRTSQGSLKAGSTISVGFHLVSAACYGIGGILIARALGPEQAGYLALFITGTAVLGTVTDVLGVSYANAYLVAAGERTNSIGHSFGSVALYGGAIGILTVAVLEWTPLYGLLFRGLSGDTWHALVALDAVGLCITTQLRAVFLGGQRFILMGLMTVGSSFLFASVALVLIYGYGRETATAAAVAHVGATGTCLLLACLYLLRRGIKPPSLRYLESCVRLGWRASGAYWVSYLHLRVDQLIVNRILGPVSVGLYSTAVSIGELITQVPNVLGLVLFSHVASQREGKAEAAAGVLRRTVITMAFVSVFGAIMGIAAPAIVSFLYGEEFRGAARLLRFLIPAIVFISGVHVVNNYVSGLGYPLYQVATALVALVVNVALNALLLSRLGVVGAPLASAASYGLWLALLMAYVQVRGHPTVDSGEVRADEVV